MKALRIARHGHLSDLTPQEVDEPRAAEGEVVVRVEAAAINPSDVASVMGGFPGAPLPRIVGRDFAGTVEAGPAELVGARVWGSGG